MLIPHGTIVALVDGQEWQLFRNAGNEAAPDLAAMETPELVHHGHSSGGSHATPHQQDETQHATNVADWFNRQVLGHKFDHLIVIAAPRTLGELRHHYSKGVQKALLAELAKDLIGAKPADIIAALRGK